MKTEARKSFYHGFVLTEQELRRIVDVATQQLEKVAARKPHTYIQVKFRNGTITDAASLDDLLSIENVGSKQIINRRILLTEGENEDDDIEKTDHFILLRFTNPEEDEDPRPISYVVRGTQRDWVFVTASELDERVTKIKCLSPRTLFWGKPRFPFVSAFLAIMALSVLAAITFTVTRSQPSVAQAIESQWKAGTLRDPIQAIIIQEQYYEASRRLANPRFVLFIAAIAAALMTGVLALIVQLAIILFPAYVFCWGDNTKLYERRVQIRRYVLGGVLLTLVLGIIASVIGNKLTLGR